MALTTQQLQTLKTAINADPALSSQPMTSGGALVIADALNLTASPTWYAWRKSVYTASIGAAVNYEAVAAMTTANLDRVKTFYTMNPALFAGRPDIRQFFSDTFSGALGGQGQATRDAVDALLYRTVSRFERLYTTGTGTIADPATLAVEGPVSSADVQQARELP